MSIRASAITAAGIVLSQPTMQTRPSSRCPSATSSIESAIRSREMSEARMPLVPIETPSETEIVLNSIGVPPASRMPSLTAFARKRWLRLHGIVSIHSCATPTSGFARSSSLKPTAFSIARAGARSTPSVRAALLRLAGSVGWSYTLKALASFAPMNEQVECLDGDPAQAGRVACSRGVGSLAGDGEGKDAGARETPLQFRHGAWHRTCPVEPDDDGRARTGQRDAALALDRLLLQRREHWSVLQTEGFVQ